MDFNFWNPTCIIGYPGCIPQAAEQLWTVGGRALIVTGTNAARLSGALDDVIAALQRGGIAFELFGGVRQNPLLSTCLDISGRARAFGADYILAIGGGSVIDAARAACALATGRFDRREGDLFLAPVTDALPLVAVGTTAGTGSEVDPIAVITEDATGFKKSVKGPALCARYAFCDYHYTKSMTLRQTVSTGLDALCHCLESWFNTQTTETAAGFAARGAGLIFPRLAELADGGFDPDSDSLRKDLYHGSLWGGLAITICGTGFPHPAGYPLTEQGGIPHGVACALYQPAFLRHVLPYLHPRDRDRFTGITGGLDRAIAVIEALTRHNITVSDALCAATADRLDAAANTPKTPGGYSGQQGQAVARRLFLRTGQRVPVSGEWLFGLD